MSNNDFIEFQQAVIQNSDRVVKQLKDVLKLGVIILAYRALNVT